MSAAHEIVWSFERDTVTQRLVCHDDDCQHRYTCPEPCEVLYGVEAVEGGYRHAAVESFDGRVTTWHQMVKRDECSFAEWLNIDPHEIPELCEERDRFEIGRTPVEAAWSGDDAVQWKRVLPTISGADQ